MSAAHDEGVGGDLAVVPTSATAFEAGMSLTELISSFYVWLVLWLLVWAVVPALLLRWEPVLITSGSMGPTITAGDLVLIAEPPDDELLAPGTVITFRNPADPSGLVTHRIDGVRDDGLYRTRGDANEGPDSSPVAPSDVVGVARMLVPLVGLPVLWLRADVLSFVVFVVGTTAAVLVSMSSRRAAAGAAARRERAARLGLDDEPDVWVGGA